MEACHSSTRCASSPSYASVSGTYSDSELKCVILTSYTHFTGSTRGAPIFEKWGILAMNSYLFDLACWTSYFYVHFSCVFRNRWTTGLLAGFNPLVYTLVTSFEKHTLLKRLRACFKRRENCSILYRLLLCISNALHHASDILHFCIAG